MSMLPSFAPLRQLLPVGLALAVGWMTACEYPEVVKRTESHSSANGAFVWRGFDHRWSYNHRLKRIGDFLTQQTCSGGIRAPLPKLSCRGATHHTAAAGTGSDELAFTSHYTQTATADADFHTTGTRIAFEGRQKRELRRQKTVNVPVDSGGEFIALLNGYDLRTVATAKAKKLKRFRVWIAEKANYDPEDGEVDVEIGGLLDVNCSSAECLLQSNRVQYRLDVELLVVRADDLRAHTRQFQTRYRWGRQKELRRHDLALNRQRQSISGDPEVYELGLVGFRELDFDLTVSGKYEDHWFVEWEQSLTDVDYRARSGRASFDLTMFFKEWNARTKSQMLSLAKSGEATLSSDVTLLQLPRGDARRGHHTGELTWQGRTSSSHAPTGVSWNDLHFEF